MATVHMTEAEVARDLHAILAQVQKGDEIVIEEDHRTVAIIRSPIRKGRLLSECIALAEARPRFRTRASCRTLKKASRNATSHGILRPGSKALVPVV